MIKIYVILLISLLSFTNAQNYNPIANYNFNGTPVNGIKIKTSIPYSDGSQMPNIIIEGYNYGSMEPINLSLVWYIYGGNFINYGVTSTSSYTPEIKLSNEKGKVVIFINDRQYFTRFSVRGFAQGMREDSSWFTNWTISDESLTGINTVDLTYKNAFNQAKVFHQGTWKADGSVGIGTTNPQNKLDVNGTVHAKEVKVDMQGWADFVFKNDYSLLPLEAVEKFIAKNGHLPGIPSEKQVLKEGINLGEMNKHLLQKIEELTLYQIELYKIILQIEQDNKSLKELLK